MRAKSARALAAVVSASSASGLTRSTLLSTRIFGWRTPSRLSRMASASPLMPRSASISTSTISASLAPPQAVVTMARSSRAARLEDAGRVDEDDLRVAVRGDAAHDGARRLHLVGDDRHLGADQLVDQRRLAGIGRADQRDEARMGRRRCLPGGLAHAPVSCFQTPSRRRIAAAAACLGLPLGAAAAARRLEAGELHADGEERVVVGTLAAVDAVDRHAAADLVRPFLQFGLGVAAGFAASRSSAAPSSAG